MQKRLPISDKVGFIIPVLAGCYTVLSMFSEQSFRLSWSLLPIPMGIGASVGMLIWLLFYAVPLTRNSSALVATAATLAVMLWTTFPYPIIPTMSVISVIVVLYDLPRSALARLSFAVLVILVVTVAVSLGWAEYNSMSRANGSVSQDSGIKMTSTPDIYFIVPDRFTSPQGLAEFGVDPSWFVSELEDRGFYVPWDNVSTDTATPSSKEESTTTRTLRFMASALSCGDDVSLTTPYNTASNMVKGNKAARILKANGYTYHHIGDWWQETLSNPQADYNYVYRGYSVMDYLAGNELSMAVVDRSWLRDLNFGFALSADRLFSANRARNLYQMSAFKAIASRDNEEPRFVMVHLLLPHPPYMWTADGEPRMGGGTEEEQYLDQVQFTMRFLLEMVDSVSNMENSVMIIQSDEGVAFAAQEDNNRLSNNQWNGVLSAWHVPNAGSNEMEGMETTDILCYVIKQYQNG